MLPHKTKPFSINKNDVMKRHTKSHTRFPGFPLTYSFPDNMGSIHWKIPAKFMKRIDLISELGSNLSFPWFFEMMKLIIIMFDNTEFAIWLLILQSSLFTVLSAFHISYCRCPSIPNKEGKFLRLPPLRNSAYWASGSWRISPSSKRRSRRTWGLYRSPLVSLS